MKLENATELRAGGKRKGIIIKRGDEKILILTECSIMYCETIQRERLIQRVCTAANLVLAGKFL